MTMLRKMCMALILLVVATVPSTATAVTRGDCSPQNGVCEESLGETCDTCVDCYPISECYCGDNVCQSAEEWGAPYPCPTDCGYCLDDWDCPGVLSTCCDAECRECCTDSDCGSFWYCTDWHTCMPITE